MLISTIKDVDDIKPVIIALDFNNQIQMQNFLNEFKGVEDLTVKVGMEMFYQYGPELVKNLRKQKFKVFLDLKLNDIPNTVERAMIQIAKLDVQFVTVHALGGLAMMQAAIRGAQNGAEQSGLKKPKILAVTELTSISAESLKNEQNVSLSMAEQVASLTELARKAGTDGVICSALDLHQVEPNDQFLYVTPGIRPTEFAAGDQKRVVTPQEAAQRGSSAIVVGRPITQSDNPVQVYQNIVKEWSRQ